MLSITTTALALCLAAQPGIHPWQVQASPGYTPDAIGFVGGDEPADDGEDTPDSPEDAETEGSGEVTDGALLYSRDLSDAELERRFLEDPGSLGSISVGFSEAGRVINAVQLPRGDAWVVKDPANAWGTQETIDALVTVANAVRERRPGIGPMRINDIGKQEGGYLRPHRSHQSGRDVDIGLFYLDGGGAYFAGHKTRVIDLGANWQLLRAVASMTDAQVVLIDRKVQKLLYDYAIATGEDRSFVNSIFKAGRDSLVQHAARHRDHFHVRFFSPRAHELGRRIQPLLAKKQEENLAIHRVKKGDTLGRIAMIYGSTVKLIQKANAMKGAFLSRGRTLRVPLRGPCTRCPLPPPLVLPPRRLPPQMQG